MVPEVQNRGISSPTKGHVSPPNFFLKDFVIIMLSEVDPQFTVGGETSVLSENYHNPEGTFISVIAVGKFKQSY